MVTTVTSRAVRFTDHPFALSSLLILPLFLLLPACADEEGSEVVGEAATEGRTLDRRGEDVRSATITIAFWNVENLFDTEDDPAVDDDEFTPHGRMAWTPERLDRKLENIARGIGAFDSGRGADVVGLAEVENRSVLERLVAEFLAEPGVDIVHVDSPDGRGIDVALLYRSEILVVRNHSYHQIDLGRGERPTRGILNVEFERTSERFNVMVSHWPSRSGGEKRSRWKRERAAAVQRRVLDSILAVDPARDVVMLGDFNDSPLDRAVREGLGAGPVGAVRKGRPPVWNLGWSIAEVDTVGTYLYRRDWDVLDQIIVAGGLADDRALGLLDEEMTVFAPPFLRDDHPSQPERPPRRTYVRRTLYIGGTSDHFPVYARFRWSGREAR